jgi:mannan endo-1,4-beta-mannosidase
MILEKGLFKKYSRSMFFFMQLVRTKKLADALKTNGTLKQYNLWITCAVIVFVAFVFTSCSFLSFIYEKDDFIRVQGTQFIHNGKPYYFAGANLWYGCYLGSPGETGDRSRLLRELDTLQAYGITNLRLLGASEDSYIRRSIKPAIQRAARVDDDSLLMGLDFILSEIDKRHMHAVLYLNNYWEWSGGMAQYVVWATGTDGADPENPQKGYGNFMDFSATFYSTPKAVMLYEEYVKRIMTRKNSINGRIYSEDPSIMSWQLANEPRPGRDGDAGNKNLPAFYEWINRTAKFIHTLDTNHLVSTGSEGKVGCIQREEVFLESHKSQYIDYLTFHLWPLNWGWFDPKHISETLPSSENNAVRYLNLHLEMARTLHKPIVMEEFGIGRDSAEFLPGTPTSARDHYYQVLYKALHDSAHIGAPIAGSNFWAWGGEGKTLHADGIWQRGDPYVGDPPQEPQGRNSIFLQDKSTLDIIRDHARKMEKLCIIDSLLKTAK